MATSKAQLREWFDKGKAEGSLFLIVVCDTFDYDDYPVFVGPDDEFAKLYDEHNGRNMQRIMEVYDLGMDRELQMAERRAFHYPAGFEVAA